MVRIQHGRDWKTQAKSSLPNPTRAISENSLTLCVQLPPQCDHLYTQVVDNCVDSLGLIGAERGIGPKKPRIWLGKLWRCTVAAS